MKSTILATRPVLETISNTSPPSATASKFRIGILLSLDQVLKVHHCHIELRGAKRSLFHYSQHRRALCVRLTRMFSIFRKPEHNWLQ